MSKERGMIFQAWGVNAIRNMKPGVWPAEAIDPALPIKPMTRRLSGLNEINKRPDDWRFAGWSSLKEGLAVFGDMAASEPMVTAIKCPYGVPGDILYVRETHYRLGRWVKDGLTKTGRQRWRFKPAKGEHVRYTDAPPARLGRKRGAHRNEWWKRPSIFMPRWASREDLVLKEVRVERVQEISEEDAAAEGIRFDGTYWLGGIHPVKGTLQCWPTARRAFQAIWDAINKKRGYGWEPNPWPWVLSYMRI